MKRALIIDTETQGLDVSKHAVVEVAAVVFDLEYFTQLEAFASLLPVETNEAEAINRIPAKATRMGCPPELDKGLRESRWDAIRTLGDRCDIVLAHNADFDRGFVEIGAGGPLLKTLRAGEQLRRVAMPWVCTKDDITWPKQFNQGMSLVPLLLAHGLGVGSAHRALDDVLMICRLLTRVHEMGVDVRALLERGMRPKTKLISLAPFAAKDEVKAHGFRWDAEKKEWWRCMPIEDAAALPFKVKPAEGRR